MKTIWRVVQNTIFRALNLQWETCKLLWQAVGTGPKAIVCQPWRHFKCKMAQLLLTAFRWLARLVVDLWYASFLCHIWHSTFWGGHPSSFWCLDFINILCWNLQARLSLVTVPDSGTYLAFEHGDFAAVWFQPDDKKFWFCNCFFPLL